MSTINDATLALAVSIWLKACRIMINTHYQSHYPSIGVPTLVIETCNKYMRVIKRESFQGEGVSGSAWAFIALQDGQTKGMGTIKQGDVFKPATRSAPAKHARGNVFDAEGGLKYMTAYGPAYLR